MIDKNLDQVENSGAIEIKNLMNHSCVLVLVYSLTLLANAPHIFQT